MERLESEADVVAMFDVFRQEWDDSNDRRERLIKLSREITIKSKRIIFFLHRSSEISQNNQREAAKKTHSTQHLFSEIKHSFQEISTELQDGYIFWKYHKTFSPGLQEYIEALSFAKYLEDQTLLSFRDVQEDLKSFFPFGVPYSDYFLGISDLTGELMRLTVSSVGSQGISSREVFASTQSVCNFVRNCKASWEPMSVYITELRAKQEVTTASLRKIEEVVYSLAIRGLGDARVGEVNVFQPSYDDEEDSQNNLLH